MDYYYQIKGKLAEPGEGLYGGVSNWMFPPLFVGKVTANDKKEAKRIIDEEYGRVFPLRVLQKDLATNEFLLAIEEIKPGSHIARLFEQTDCAHCQKPFYPIDKYNDAGCVNKSPTYCSDKCKQNNYEVKIYQRPIYDELASGTSNPVIYRITNRIDQNKCYIGKTTQIFTLRWYQHFFHGGENKFHQAIRNSKVSDWIFEIQEIITIPTDIKTTAEIEAIILERERFWIQHYNSVENGYNTLNT